MLEIRKQRIGRQRTVHERAKSRRMVNRMIVFIALFIMLIIIALIVYVWYMSRYATHINEPAPVPVDQKMIKPYAPAKDAAVGVVEQSFSESVSAGSPASIGIKTNPGAACQITVKVNNQLLPDNGLIPKIADEYGMVSWTWKVPATVAPAKWPVEITCANEAKKSGYYRAYLEVK